MNAFLIIKTIQKRKKREYLPKNYLEKSKILRKKIILKILIKFLIGTVRLALKKWKEVVEEVPAGYLINRCVFYFMNIRERFLNVNE